MQINTDIAKKVKEFVSQNSTTLLTAGGVVGTVGTAVLAGRAGIKAQQIIAEHEAEQLDSLPMEERGDVERENAKLSKTDKVKLVWPQFVPPVLAGGVTVTAIVMANRMSAQKAAALAAAYGLLENRFEDYKEKVSEKLTGPKKQAIDDELAQDRVNDNPVSKQVVIIAGGDALCYDTMSGRYFRSSVERIKRAEGEINQELFDSQMASLSEFYSKIGLAPTGMSDILGWTAFDEGIIEFEISTTLTDDNQPCLVITPSRTPSPDFHKLAGHH